MTNVPSQHRWQGARGEWLVVVQVLLCGLVMFGPRQAYGYPVWPFPSGGASLAVGGLLMVAGSALFRAGVLRQGRGLTALPYPRSGATLIQSGPYALVRHPMYSGLLAAGFGWAVFVQSGLTLAYAAALFAFLDRKSRREEGWLLERFPAYREYQQRVRRLVPFFY